MLFGAPGYAQTDDLITLKAVTVTATRTEKKAFVTPNTVYSLSGQDLQNYKMARTIPEALNEIPGIMVQKTAHGQGSPFIRGFTGFRTLFLIDGIRLNNSVFRDGPNQYWNTVDPFSIGQLDIIKGPNSVLYGSDAIGGSVNAITIRPDYKDKTGKNFRQRAYYRFSDAENSSIMRGETGFTWNNKWGFILGYSNKNFGDLEGGKKTGRQKKTGYDESNWDIKIEYNPANDSRLTFAHQKTNQDDMWRAHKTKYGLSWEGIQIGNEYARILDQDRTLTYLKYSAKKLGLIIDRLNITLSYQVQEENRYRLRTKNGSFISDIQGVDVATTGVSVQMDTYSSLGAITYGFEYYHDDVDSFKKDYKGDLKHGGLLSDIKIQGPVADDATYDLLGIYIQCDMAPLKFLDLILGARYNYIKADANKVQNPETGGRMTVNEDWDALVGSARILYHMDTKGHYKIFCGISQGFRAPNLSDLTRLDSARSNEIETAAPDLDPEKYITCETGFKIRFDRFTSQLAYFYTDIKDMVVRAPTGVNLGDANDPEHEVTKKNSGNGYLQGFEVSARLKIYEQFTLFQDAGWIDGEVDTYPFSTPVKVKEPLSRLMPTTCRLGIRWEPENTVWLEGIVAMADAADDLSTRDKSDLQRIPPGGTPGYAVWSIRGGWRITDSITASAAVENIFDKDYRIHGSGQNEPGTNFKFALDCRF